MVTRTIAVVLTLCCVTVLTGCWDAMELNRRAVVAGIGVDFDPEAEKQYLVSFQVIIADEILGKASRGATPTSLHSGKGNTISEAIRDASRTLPRLISTAHTRLIIISEAVARRGISEVMDFLDRDSDIRLSANVIITRGDIRAADIAASLTPIGKINAFTISEKVAMTAQQSGTSLMIQIDDILRDLLTPGGGPVINSVEPVGNIREAGKKSSLENVESPGIVRISALAVFKGDKLVDWLTSAEGRGLVWIRNKMRKTALDIGSDQEKGNIAVDVTRSRTSLKARLTDSSHPVIQVNVSVLLSIREVDSEADLRSPEELHSIEQKANEAISRDLRAAVQKAQSARSDIFRFGDVIERENPAAWKKMEERWEDLFPQIEVEYTVDSVIRNTQSRDRPYNYKQGS